MPKQSSVLKNCPCKDTTCRFAFLCPGFKAFDLNSKVAFAKDQQLCRCCLIKHPKGECKFNNHHNCQRQEENNKHHHLLCPMESRAKVVAGAYEIEDPDSNDIGTLLNVLDSLDIDCVDFFHEIPLHEIEMDTDTDSSDSDDSDEDEGYNYNGVILVSRFTSYLSGNRQLSHTAES